MSSYDKLRYSFDNILKELDDICKSIDDLTDIEQTYYLNKNKIKTANACSSSNGNYNARNKSNTELTYTPRSNNNKFIDNEYKKYNKTNNLLNEANLIINKIVRDTGPNGARHIRFNETVENSNSSKNVALKSRQNSIKSLAERSPSSQAAYEQFKKSFMLQTPKNYSTNKYTKPHTMPEYFSLSPKESKMTTNLEPTIVHSTATNNQNELIKLSNEIKGLIENQNNDDYDDTTKPNQSSNENKSNKSYLNDVLRIDEPSADTQRKPTLELRKPTSKLKPHRLPENNSLNSVIGSAHDSSLFQKLFQFPMATNTSHNFTNSTQEQNNNNNNEKHEHKTTENNSITLNQASSSIEQFLKPKLTTPLLNKKANLPHQVSFSSVDLEDELNKDNNNNNSAIPQINQEIKSNEKKVELQIDSKSSNIEDHDYLSPNEVAKIECFYNSMGCYVYVSHCVAELYQIKREDEFDSMDTDPVSDYHAFMKNRLKQRSRPKKPPVRISSDNEKSSKVNKNNENTTDNGFSVDIGRDYLSNDEVFMNPSDAQNDNDEYVNKSTVNYMYINSGVPVIIFNYGANPKRKKDLRVLLAERSTGFCMWEFKFDRLTRYEDTNEMTVIRLTLNNSEAERNVYNTMNNNSYLSPPTPFGYSNLNGAKNAQFLSQNSFNYHNEYFEKFFNSKGRHAHKEHMLKFAIKRDCDQFCYELAKIMNDRRNGDLFFNDLLINAEPSSKSNSISQLNDLGGGYFTRNGPNYRSNNSLNSLNNSSIHPFIAQMPENAFLASSSVIICHFDFLIYNSTTNLIQTPSIAKKLEDTASIFKNQSLSSLSLAKYDSGLKKPSGSALNLIKKSSIKPSNLLRKYSNSSSTIAPATLSLGKLVGLNRKDSIGSTDDHLDIDILKTANDDASIASGVGSNANESRSVIDFDEFRSRNLDSSMKSVIVKYRKLRKSDISSPVNFNHITHLDKPVAIGKRYKNFLN